MSSGRNRDSLKEFVQVFERLSLDKRMSAAKWLEGVIVAQSLTAEERNSLVDASNKYIGDVGEAEFVDAVNTLIDYLRQVQKESKRELKKMNGKCATETVAAV